MKRASLFTLFILSFWLVPESSRASEVPTRGFLENPQDLSAPFQEGERLRYEINWQPLFLMPAFKVGELTLSIKDSHFQERPVYALSADAFSAGLLSSVAGLEVRDHIESDIDHETFQSYRILRQTRRNERKRDMEVLFDYQKDSIFLHELNTEIEPPLEIRDEETQGIPGPVADILSVFYVARLRSLHPGDSYLIHLNDKGKVKPVTIQVQAREKVTTDIGSFDSVKISTVGGLFSNGGDFQIWYSTDKLRFPVQFEAEAKIGKVYGKLIGLETPQMTKSVIRID